MNESPVRTHADFVLPPSVVSKIDVSRLVSEIERVDNELTTAAVRAKTGTEEVTRPALSDQLTDFMSGNGIAVDDGQGRSELIKQLRLFKDKAPVIHMTFAVTADRESLQQIVQWLRTSVHPQALLSVGLQPALVAGVYMRTPNRVHDFSLRAALDGRHDLLVQELGALRERR